MPRQIFEGVEGVHAVQSMSLWVLRPLNAARLQHVFLKNGFPQLIQPFEYVKILVNEGLFFDIVGDFFQAWTLPLRFQANLPLQGTWAQFFPLPLPLWRLTDPGAGCRGLPLGPELGLTEKSPACRREQRRLIASLGVVDMIWHMGGTCVPPLGAPATGGGQTTFPRAFLPLCPLAPGLGNLEGEIH